MTTSCVEATSVRKAVSSRFAKRSGVTGREERVEAWDLVRMRAVVGSFARKGFERTVVNMLPPLKL